jgi:transcriptional regulator with GAF, ATPase, and Fis domain
MNASRPEGHVETPATAVTSLAELRLSEDSLDSILAHIARLALEALDGWDAAGTSLVEDGKAATFGLTDERIRALDQSQYDTGRGPCVDAARNLKLTYFNGESVEPRWRQFAEVAADAGVYSVISFPLALDGKPLGALNFYSSERDALRPGQREEGQVFASQAAVTLANAQAIRSAGEQVGQLHDALATRTMIGQATGLLMAQEGLTSEEAFQKLVKVSQNANIKLRDVAGRYVEAWEQKAGGGPTDVP